ncbi:outer membrane lipoprotein carrier protein LolA [bacterium RCC_150]
MTRSSMRWLPAALVPVAIAGAALVGSYQAGAVTALPQKSAADIIAMVARSDVRALSGTLSQTSDLGLPQLPSAGPFPSTGSTSQGAAAAIELLGTSHTARVYLDGPSKARFQVMDTLAERDVVRNGNELWLYSSKENTATHLTLPPEPGTGTHAPAKHATNTPGATTPEALAQRFLAAVDPSTEVTVGEATTLAGRTAYELVLKPRSAGTLVDSVSIAVDSVTGLPLGIDVQARGQTAPAFSLAFSAVNLSAPDASLFNFTPPPGAAVQQKAIPQMPAMPSKEQAGKHPTVTGPTVTGSGWDAVASFPAGTLPADVRATPALTQVTQAVPGGRALTTSLVTVLMLDDGRVFAGMVPLDRLQAAAAHQ